MSSRLIAGLWFGASVLIPTLLISISRLNSTKESETLYFILAPTLITGIFGSMIGKYILEKSAVGSAIVALVIGFGVLFLSLVTFLLVTSVIVGLLNFSFATLYVSLIYSIS